MKTTVDDLQFDSKREATRWSELLLLQAGGRITQLARQVAFPLVVNGEQVGVYIADFTYRETEFVCQENRALVVEDVKGVRTREYRLKKRLMYACHGIRIKET